MNRSKKHALNEREARRVEGTPWFTSGTAWLVVKSLVATCLIVCSVGGTGCYQSTVVPPTASIPSSMRPNPIQTPPVESFSPPTMHPIDPITKKNPWKPDIESRDWSYIVLHHTAAESGSVESIHEEHLKRKDKNGKQWLGVGYHFVIGNGKGMGDGEIEPTFRWRQQMQGAHAGVADYNQLGIGIVLIGNFEESPPTKAQVAAVKKLVGILKRDYRIVGNKIVGHSDVKATECPGKYFPMSDVRDSIAFTGEEVSLQDSPRPSIPIRTVSRQIITKLDPVGLKVSPGELRK
ncbi:N-acetylmuramoyl-L-alanine amidase [Schlesneria sp. T3-172]|uniref:peptidoglycan recognition protein family protein n=1 Tax=Schlesneria sphaerica TaxID=3373610 RepID=UPI0037C696E4